MTVPLAVSPAYATGPPQIAANGLTRRFGSVTAVENLELTVDAGEICALLGENGAGKTTTVRMLATLLRPDAGQATVAGYDVLTQSAAVRARLGFALQESALDQLATGRELLRFHARLGGRSRRASRRRADELLATVGLADHADRRIGTYSGGMRRRLDLAAAMVNGPQVLFLDEPTTGLDPAARRSLWDEVRRLRNEGVAVLLTTQYLEEADVLADRVVILSAGRVAARGVPSQLKVALGGSAIHASLPGGQREEAAGLLRTCSFVDWVTTDDRGVVVSTAADNLVDVVNFLATRSLSPIAVRVVEPTLDDVFLKVVGARPAPSPTWPGTEVR